MSPRLAATGALVSWLGLVAALIVFLFNHPRELVVTLIGAALLLVGAWGILTERRLLRYLSVAVAVVAVVMILGAIVNSDSERTNVALKIALVLTLIAGFELFGHRAVRAAAGSPDMEAHPHVRPHRPVLIGNPWSGGGKVESFGLEALAKELGVEVVMLAEGLDLEELARDAVAGGADAIGMAGGDGSQALVASIAAEHDIPYVCIPAGTRNHLALDLGLNRDDPRPAMVAFTEGVERRIDFGTVNGRLFVNNVSLGVYAEIVQQDDYRDAKVETTLDMLPDMLGRQAEPFDLQVTLPDGTQIDGAYVIQVSNNPYLDSSLLQFGERPRLDTGTLGMIALWEGSDVTVTEIIAAAARRRLEQTGALASIECAEIQVRSRSGTAYVGVDGEALEMDTPLDFRIHPGGLRLLVPPGNIAAAHERATGKVTLNRLWQIARGTETAA
jgi:diacylglycerol kinase family enzyme